MGVPSSAPPPVGTVGVGEMLADAQTKTIWLGVPASIDAQQSILVSDLIGLQADIDAAIIEAEDYTDSVAALKSDVGHHHAIADVDGLAAALADASNALPLGCIVIWHGILGDIPGGWALCDGANGTPDLRDKFILGAGGSTGNALDVGGSKNFSATTNTAGGHTPAGTVQPTALTIAQLPAHTHSISDPGHTHAINDPGHNHIIDSRIGNNADYLGAGSSPSAYYQGATRVAFTGIGIVGRVTGITGTNAAGSGDGHTHGITFSAVGGHNHTVSGQVMPPYIILGYIMRV